MWTEIIINQTKGGKIMIKSEHVREDLDKIKVKGENVTMADAVHTMALLVKVALDIRQNQVAIMKHNKVALSTRRESPKKSE